MAEAASELASFASVDGAAGGQEWRPIVEGELAKARVIQSESAGLGRREIEQAVISVFLSSQPVGHKALTPELMVLLGAGGPDKIELEKALRRWTELSWFLDEVEVATGGIGPDGVPALAQGMAAGQPSQPAPDASRRLQYPRAARARRIAAHRCHREAKDAYIGCGRGRRKGAQPAGAAARHRG